MTGLRAGALRAIDHRGARAAPPEIGAVADRLYADMTPLAWLDEDNDWALAVLCGAVGQMFEEVDELARDTPEAVGWSMVLDLARCPPGWLPWLGQFVGVTVPVGLSDSAARALIADRSGFKRGRPEAIVLAAQTTLTDTKAVYLQERYAGDAYVLAVRTVESETPDVAATRAAILAAKPGGLVLDYATVIGFSYDLLSVEYATYADVKAAFVSYDALRQGIHI